MDVLVTLLAPGHQVHGDAESGKDDVIAHIFPGYNIVAFHGGACTSKVGCDGDVQFLEAARQDAFDLFLIESAVLDQEACCPGGPLPL